MLSAIFLLFFFFFSSRRRHTRLQGDWSSDVCSSDLVRAGHVASHVCADAVAYLVRRGCPAKERAERAPHPRHRGRSALCRHSFRARARRSEEHTSELQSPCNLVCRLLLEKKKTDVPTSSESMIQLARDSVPALFSSTDAPPNSRLRSVSHCCFTSHPGKYTVTLTSAYYLL